MTIAARTLLGLIQAEMPSAASVATALGYTTYAGDPTNNLTPTHIGQFCMDTSGAHLYWAGTAASSGWKKLNN
jgi:hypothetical protein